MMGITNPYSIHELILPKQGQKNGSLDLSNARAEIQKQWNASWTLAHMSHAKKQAAFLSTILILVV